MGDRWVRLVEAVGAATGMESASAEAYLQDTLRDDPELLAEAREILAGGLEGDAFLHPEAVAPRTSGGALVEGAQIGPFRIVRLLGEGGMGSVFLAQQTQPKRQVALKLLRSSLPSEKARARFEYEVQALASLRHRGIAQVYEAGVQRLDDGLMAREVPWFAMEYIEDARTIIAHAASRSLTLRERLGLFLEVLEAVHHGHQKGVVHRDLKPDNVLVGATGHVKVIDFGVAKSAEPDAPPTTVGAGIPSIVGTLPYLAPERVTSGRAAADVRSDVYALGVTLFQLLTGKLPIEVDTTDIVTSSRRICEETPPLPSSTNAELPRDLDAVLLKSLAKDPGERYASVDALADDLRRFLEHRPVGARTPGALYHARLFARRHRSLVTSAAIVFVVGLAATWISVTWALESEEAEQRAQREKAEAVEQRTRAETLFRTVFQRSFEATIREAPKLQTMPGTAERVKAMMDKVLEDLRLLESMAAGDANVQVLIAEAWQTLGDVQGNQVYANLGQPEEAERSYRRALGLLDRVLAADTGHPEATRASIRTRIRLGDILDQRERALRRRREEDPGLRAERYALLERARTDARTLLERLPEDEVAAANLSDATFKLGRIAMDEGEPGRMREHAREIVALHAAGRIDTPLLGLTLEAWSWHRAKDWARARTAWAAVVQESGRRARRDGATHMDQLEHARGLGVHGECSFLAGHRQEAATILEKAVERFEVLQARDPKDRRIGIQLYIQLTELVRVYGALAAEDQGGKRAHWLEQQRATLRRALSSLGPPEDDSRHRAGMRKRLQAQLDALGTAAGG